MHVIPPYAGYTQPAQQPVALYVMPFSPPGIGGEDDTPLSEPKTVGNPSEGGITGSRPFLRGSGLMSRFQGWVYSKPHPNQPKYSQLGACNLARGLRSNEWSNLELS